MKHLCLYPLISAALVAMLPANVTAGPILLDQSPDAYPSAIVQPAWYVGTYMNARNGQHFADTISFTSDVVVAGMGLYSGDYVGAIGDTAVIQLWADAGGAPGTLLNEFSVPITEINTDGVSRPDVINVNQKIVHFSTPLTLTANTVYWIGMSGGPDLPRGIGLNGLENATDGIIAVFEGDSLSYIRTYGGVGDAAMRLYGAPDSAATAMLVGVGLIAIGAIRRRWPG